LALFYRHCDIIALFVILCEAHQSKTQAPATTEDIEMQIHDFQPMFEVKWRCFLTNSVEKGFSQPWEPLLVALANKRGQRQGFERTNFFFFFLFVTEFTSGRSSKKGIVLRFLVLVFEEKCERANLK